MTARSTIARVTRTGRAPLRSFSMPFGLSGLAGTWTMAAHTGLATSAIAEALWILAAAVWIVVVTNYVWRSRNEDGSILRDLQDPVEGPSASAVSTLCTPATFSRPRQRRSSSVRAPARSGGTFWARRR